MSLIENNSNINPTNPNPGSSVLFDMTFYNDP